MIFQPHDGGCFSQLWDLVVTHGVGRGGGGSAEEEEEQKLRISFGGKVWGKWRGPCNQDTNDIIISHRGCPGD